jgi:hypothetical protein
MAHMLRQSIASAVVCIFSVLTVAVADAQTVKLGVLTPLSVPGDANAGKLIVRGARLGEEYVNTVMGGIRGGHKIELRIEDDTGVPEKGVSGYRKLVTQDEVVVVLGQYHSSVMLAVQKLADKMGTPVFSTQASNKNITLNQYATTFRTHAIDSDRVTLWLGFIKGQGYKRVALIAENTDYGLGLIEDTKEQNQEMGLNHGVYRWHAQLLGSGDRRHVYSDRLRAAARQCGVFPGLCTVHSRSSRAPYGDFCAAGHCADALLRDGINGLLQAVWPSVRRIFAKAPASLTGK